MKWYAKQQRKHCLSCMFAAAVYMCGSLKPVHPTIQLSSTIEFVGHWLSTLDCYLWADPVPCITKLDEMVSKELKCALQTSCSRQDMAWQNCSRSPPRKQPAAINSGLKLFHSVSANTFTRACIQTIHTDMHTKTTICKTESVFASLDPSRSLLVT